jgi:adenylylsulfate kinase
MVVWIIGLSGTGKTTLANAVVEIVRRSQSNIVLIDGDMIREVFGNDLGYTMEDRLINAQRICQLGKFFEDQGINVVCAILSIFPETRAWNRSNLKNYYEVFIDTPIESLIKRDSKGIYSKFVRGEIQDVAGMDIEFLRPDNTDLIINNTRSKRELLAYAEPIAHKIMDINRDD